MVELEEEETLAGKAGAGGAPRRTVSARRCCVRASPVSRSCGASPCGRRVPHSKRHNRIPQRGVTCRTDGRRRNGLAMQQQQQQQARACDQGGAKARSLFLAELEPAGVTISNPAAAHYASGLP